MKKYILIIVTSFAISQSAYSQTNDQRIENIEKTIKEIKNNLNKYQKVEKLNDNNGIKYVYKDGNELKIISLVVNDSETNKSVEWYFANGQLIYSQQIWIDQKSNEIIDNEKCYLISGQLIAWTKNNKTVDTTTEEFKKVNSELQAYAKVLLAQ